MTDTKPGPCPFCGSEARLSESDDRYLDKFYWAECSNNNCAATGSIKHTSAETISAWNAPRGKIERLGAERDDYWQRLQDIKKLMIEAVRDIGGEEAVAKLLSQQKGGE